MSEAIKLAVQLHELLAKLTDKERVELLAIVLEGYCDLCGGPQRPCQCANDE